MLSNRPLHAPCTFPNSACITESRQSTNISKIKLVQKGQRMSHSSTVPSYLNQAAPFGSFKIYSISQNAPTALREQVWSCSWCGFYFLIYYECLKKCTLLCCPHLDSLKLNRAFISTLVCVLNFTFSMSSECWQICKCYQNWSRPWVNSIHQVLQILFRYFKQWPQLLYIKYVLCHLCCMRIYYMIWYFSTLTKTFENIP